MATANKVSVIPCGAMSADLTWLLLKPGRSITDRHHKDAPQPWVDVPTHCVLVETDEGKILWDTSCPRDWEERWGPTGLQDFFPYDKVADDEYLDSRLNQMGVGLDEIDYVILS
ncbi:MAG: N-acyl homoserine lactone hydrolase, partial [Pseudonocardiales bacterium]|nr:N-acyl homoserine lactone hydrolase [Pseudonocardiales bacterium]